MAKAIKVLSVGKVEEVGENKTRLARVEVLTLDLKETLMVGCFLGKDGSADDIKVGYDYEAEIAEGKAYKGKKQYSMPLWKMKEMPKADPIKEEADEEKAMWDQKEMRSHRRACLAIASGMISEEVKAGFGSPTTDPIKILMENADRLVKYVYDEIPF